MLGGARKAAAPSVPGGVVAYAIGDVHGRADLLMPLLERVLDEHRRLDGARMVLVGLGDYVDRGPGSREVLETLIELTHFGPLETHFLKGNHDQAMLDFLGDPERGEAWCEFGGREAMASYGVAAPAGRSAPEAWHDARDALEAAMPPSHVAFLRGLENAFVLGDYFFSHAGARPGVALEDQTETDLLWIRQPFLQDRRAFDKIVVHGHTPAEEAYADHRRIGLDTGAYATGLLTAMRLEGDERRLVQARRTPDGSFQLIDSDF